MSGGNSNSPGVKAIRVVQPPGVPEVITAGMMIPIRRLKVPRLTSLRSAPQRSLDKDGSRADLKLEQNHD